ncbi:hypothetical protein ACFFKC_22960, partial [Pseudoduganella danionis]|uniref:hypothetical protein n=1 Tax=Pseudoduganella danionis TaxID=1890295 RepID=UPI0035E80415
CEHLIFFKYHEDWLRVHFHQTSTLIDCEFLKNFSLVLLAAFRQIVLFVSSREVRLWGISHISSSPPSIQFDFTYARAKLVFAVKSLSLYKK